MSLPDRGVLCYKKKINKKKRRREKNSQKSKNLASRRRVKISHWTKRPVTLAIPEAGGDGSERAGARERLGETERNARVTETGTLAFRIEERKTPRASSGAYTRPPKM